MGTEAIILTWLDPIFIIENIMSDDDEKIIIAFVIIIITLMERLQPNKSKYNCVLLKRIAQQECVCSK